jgi:hypothetical protein
MVELRAPQPLRKAGHRLLGVMVYSAIRWYIKN